jgi:hypothetical protein
MSFPRYPGYLDSGVEWLGKVPAQRVNAAAGLRANGPASSQPGAAPQVRRRHGMRAESPFQRCADGSPLQGWSFSFVDTQGVALGWFGSRRWRCGGGRP